MEAEKSFDYENNFMGVGSLAERERGGALLNSKNHIIGRFREHNFEKQGKFLEFGCGGGKFSESVKKFFPKFEIYGCDISKTAINFARQVSGGNVNYRVIDGVNLPYDSNFFDVCAAIGVLEHVPDIGLVLKNLRRVLKKRGKLHIYMPCEGNGFTFTNFFKKIGFLDGMTKRNWGHIHPELTNQKLFTLLKNNGFTITQVSFSQHLISQVLNLFVYFFPKEILNCVFGEKKAFDYSDAGIILAEQNKNIKRNRNPIMYFRKLWMKIMAVNAKVIDMEAWLLKNVSFSALYLHITAEKAAD